MFQRTSRLLRTVAPRVVSRGTHFVSAPRFAPAVTPAPRFFSTKYTKDHEYVTFKGNTATIGITDFAQSELGDVVYVELPEVGQKFEQSEAFGSVESVKAASSVYAPLDIEITAINEALSSQCSLVNEDAEGKGWMIKVKLLKPAQLDALMDAKAYKEVVAKGSTH